MFLLKARDQQCDLNYSDHLEDLANIFEGTTAFLKYICPNPARDLFKL